MIDFFKERIQAPATDGQATGTTIPSQAPTRVSTKTIGAGDLLDKVRARGGVQQEASPKEQKYVYLAKLNTANGDDDAAFVIAIIADTWEQAEKIAGEHNAELLAMHDGDPKYPIINFPPTV